MNPSNFDALAWLQANLDWARTDSAAFLYEHMESQSGQCLPVIYVPFDGRRRDHVIDRGQILDFALSLAVEGRRVLDFGPGDGWPSLMIAPLAGEVVGVDGSPRRVDVCRANAERLGVHNATFVHVPVGERLPFDDASFDGIAAASSIEQTPDPHAALRELCRVLRPGGRLRMHYESLHFYHGGHERDLDLIGDGDCTQLVIYDRRIAEERAQQYGLSINLALREVEAVFERHQQAAAYAGLTQGALRELSHKVVRAATWTTQHPSCATWLRWLAEAGFSTATPAHNGGWFAGRLFDQWTEAQRPRSLNQVDRLLEPLVRVVCEMEAPAVARPGEWEPWITACK